MEFVIQENLFREEHYNTLIETMQKYNLPHRIVSVNSKEGIIQNLEDLNTKNVFVFGSVRLAHLAKQYDWFPGSFMNENHDFSVYSNGFGLENMLNGDSIICKFGDEFKIDSQVFIRPVKDSKSFTGKVFNRYDWEEFVLISLEKNSKFLTKDTLIQVASTKKILQEIRFWVVNGKIITSSYYKLGDMFYIEECKDDVAIQFAQEMVDKYKPADSFVIDLALIEDQTFKVVEINCINSSGFYANNISKLIDSLLVYDVESN